MSSKQSIGTRVREGVTLYTIEGTRDDGSTYVWFNRPNIAEVIATALCKAKEAQRKADEAAAEARSYMDAVASARSLVPDAERVKSYRGSIGARLDWAAYFLVNPHQRSDTWPVERTAELDAVRKFVLACFHEPMLEKLLMICERHHDDWADQLMRATGVLE
jgi:hypothetical protein